MEYSRNTPGVFNCLKSGDYVGAWRFWVERQKTIGDPSLSPEIKTIRNMIGCILLISGVRDWSGVSDEELDEGEYVPSLRQKLGQAAFEFTLGLFLSDKAR